MIIDLKGTEDNILANLGELCEEYNFQRRAHPGRLDTLGMPINNVTAVVRFVNDESDPPANLNAPCINQIKKIRYQIHVVWINYQGHHKIYKLAKAIANNLQGKKGLLAFCEGKKPTDYPLFIDDFRFMELDSKDNACYSYSFDILMPYAETYKTQR